jgi:site-specific DNA recombinase
MSSDVSRKRVETVVGKVVGYVRVSTEDQGEFGSSPEAQESRVRSYCEAAHLDLAYVVNVDESAKNLDRPGLKTVLASLDAGAAQGVVVAKIDRLTRDVGDLEALLRKYFGPGAGCRLYSVAEVVDTATAKGRFLLRLHVALAQLERETTVERTQEVLDYKRAKGDRTGSVPYGFDLDPTGPTNKAGRPVRLIENPVEQAMIVRIRLWHDAGHSSRAIARSLNLDAIPTKTGLATWSHSAVVKILARPERPST